MKSRKLELFIKEIQFHNRNPKDNSVLTILEDLSTNPELVLPEGALLYRTRIVKKASKLGTEEGFYGFSAKDSFVPPVEATNDLRANYKYIPYLYCSGHPYISVCEVRPRFGAQVSVASVRVNEPLTLFDLTMKHPPSKITPVKENLLADLSELYAKPVTEEDDLLEYIPTQYIAEFIKNLNYDGIVYKSSLNAAPPENDTALLANIVVFSYKKCAAVSSNLYRVTNNFLECVQIDAAPDKQEIINPVSGLHLQ
jgi:hypothetical protein